MIGQSPPPRINSTILDIIRIRITLESDFNNSFNYLPAPEDELEASEEILPSQQRAASKGGLHLPTEVFHCPTDSVGKACLSDYLRLDITTASATSKRSRLRLEVCPYASAVGWSVPTPVEEEEETGKQERELYYGLAIALPNSPPLILGPVYNFTSIDFEVNLQLGGINHEGNSTVMKHGWVKGMLFEYIREFLVI